MTRCYLCGSEQSRIIHKGVRDNPNIDVLKCENCGLIRLSSFITDSDKYYQTAQMRKHDLEKSVREIRITASVDDERRNKFISRMIENKTYLDFGCGAGGTKTRTKQGSARIWR